LMQRCSNSSSVLGNQFPLLRIALAFLVFTLGTISPAEAQKVPDSVVAVDVLAAYQAGAGGVLQTVEFEQYSETGTVTSRYPSSGGFVPDVGATVRVWRSLSAGFSWSHLHDSGSAQVSALVPHPLMAGQPRQVNGTAAVSHTEIGLHVQAAYWVQLNPRVEMVVSGGPSVFRVDQDFVSDVAYSQQFPYNTATFEGVSLVGQRKTVVGGNIGGEVGW